MVDDTSNSICDGWMDGSAWVTSQSFSLSLGLAPGGDRFVLVWLVWFDLILLICASSSSFCSSDTSDGKPRRTTRSLRTQNIITLTKNITWHQGLGTYLPSKYNIMAYSMSPWLMLCLYWRHGCQRRRFNGDAGRVHSVKVKNWAKYS